MNDNMCEKCKYRNAPASIPPCTVCKHAFLRGTKDFDDCEDFFTPADGDSKETEPKQVDHPAHYAGEIEFINAMLETMGWVDVRTFCLCTAFEYLWQCKKKHAIPTEDVEKALWYLEKYIELGGNL